MKRCPDRRGDRRGLGPGGARAARPTSAPPAMRASTPGASIGPGGGGTMRRPAISPHDPKVVLLGLRHDRRLRHRRRRRVVADVQPRLGADRLRLRPATPADALRRGRGGLPQRRRRPHVAHGPAGPGEEHGGEGDRRSRRPRPLHRRPRLSRQRPQRHGPRDRGGRGRPGARLRRRERRRLAGPGHARLADASSRVDRRRANVVASRRLRLGAGLRAPGERRREGAAGARPRRERRVRRPGHALGRVTGSRRRTLHLRRASAATRAPASSSSTRPCRSRARRSGIAGGVQVSEDGGRTWRAANGSLLAAVREVGRGDGGDRPRARCRPSGRSRSPLASRSWPTWACGGSSCPAAARRPSTGSRRPADGGRTWSVVHAESDRPSANLAASWIEPRAAEDGHSVWFDSPYDLAVAPNDPDVAYATDLFRTYRTTDGGRTWAQVNSERRGDDRWTTRGLDVTTTYGVQFDPHDPQRVFIPYTDIGLFRSEDGGETWTGSTTGIPTRWRNTTYWLAFDPEVKGLVWGGFSGTHDLPRPEDVAAHRPGALPGRRRRLDRRRPPLDASRTRAWRSRRSRTCSSTRGARRAAALSTRPRSAAASTSRSTTAHVGTQERGPRGRPAEPALRVAAHARPGRHALPRRRAPQRARSHRRRRRRRALPLDGRRRELARMTLPPGRTGRTPSPSTRRIPSGSISRPGASRAPTATRAAASS